MSQTDQTTPSLADALSPANIANPYPLYRQMREAGIARRVFRNLCGEKVVGALRPPRKRPSRGRSGNSMNKIASSHVFSPASEPHQIDLQLAKSLVPPI